MSKLLLFLMLGLLSCSTVSKDGAIDPPYEALGFEARDDHPLLLQNAKLPEEWWLIFDDQQLTGYIQSALAQNPSLQIAESRISASEAIAGRAKSTLFPYLYFGADVSRQKLSQTGVIPFSTGPKGSNTPVISVPTVPNSLIPAYFTLYETELNLRYQFDFWHKNRNTFRAAFGQVQANIAEYAYSQLELSISIAKVYYNLQVDFDRKKNAEAIRNNRSRYFDMIQKRVTANLDTELSVQIADFNLIDANDAVLQIEEDIAVNEYRLMALIAGNFDELLAPVENAPFPKVPIPTDLPLHLIAKRPDIAAQIWLIESADRQVEVARAGFYPDFNISAFFGFQTIHFQELFKWPSTFFNVDPAVTLPIFDGGRLQADLLGSEVNYNQAILQYNQLVIDAAKEVLEAFAVLKNQWARLSEFEKKVAHQKEYVDLIDLRETHGLSSGLDALTSEANMLLAQDQKLIARGRTFNAILDLIKAIGGGYDSDYCE